MASQIMRSGRVLVLANPTSQNGAASIAAHWVRDAVRSAGDTGRIAVVETRFAGDAREIARSALGRYDALVVLGGDGTIHEAATALVAAPRAQRPVFGVLPCGNGNDYARTLGLPLKGIESMWRALFEAEEHDLDVGVCNGEAFLETLSFGLDAAIALGTEERRVRTGATGTRLYLEEGAHQLLHGRVAYRFSMRLAGDEGEKRTGADAIPEAGRPASAGADAAACGPAPIEDEMHLLAVQVGPTYGGGFRICPDASPTDGLLDICYAKAPLGLARATAIFLSAKEGRHLKNADVIKAHRASSIRLELDREAPVQIDGERFGGTSFDISVLPRELRVLCSPRMRG